MAKRRHYQKLFKSIKGWRILAVLVYLIQKVYFCCIYGWHIGCINSSESFWTGVAVTLLLIGFLIWLRLLNKMIVYFYADDEDDP
jgi:hypothetical protein